MGISILVVDDFYDEPYKVREAALEFPYQDRGEQSNYPGVNSLSEIEIQGLNEYVSRLVHEPLRGTPRSGHCRFRIAMTGDDDKARLNIHVDGQSYWSGIVYLTLPEYCQGGTEFYRHKELGSDHAPLFDKDVRKFGESSCALFTKKIIRRDSNDPSKWDHVMTIPMRFNRCILFRPWFWHTSGPSFGDTLESARLVQLFFFTLDKSKLAANA